MIHQNRCGRCKKFAGNNIKCKSDTFKRGLLYANDYKCDNFDEVKGDLN